ncbi:MAG TPA: carbamoyltransferase C-terminal domain-containing protein, partial [Bryobacteraceae bacterium]|nr:carbamoyltransferase C-terminal domain-containing protein [Bryobacteraceae bacterium]
VARPMAAGPESAQLLTLRARFPEAEILVVEHHQAHAASAYFASGFSSASVLSVDRAGDYRSAVLFEGEGRVLRPVRELYFPDSLGDLFSRVTELLGYEPRADEHKVQWLSTAGTPVYAAIFSDIIGRDAAGWPKFDRRFFAADRLTGGGLSRRFYDAIGEKIGEPVPDAKKADVAASLQQAVNDAVGSMFGIAQSVCIAGGLALNALLIRSLEQRFPRVFVQPSSSNAGTALGAALSAAGDPIPFSTLCLGPAFGPDEIKQVLENCKLRFRYLPTEAELIDEAVRALSDNQIVGWMQGRMEFGPRALGNRSILASPLNPYSTENLNIYIKHRERFRKFAASVPVELAGEYFDVGSNASYLATVGTVKPQHQDRFAAALLGDALVRVHVVSKDENPLYHSLLLAAGQATGLPILYNTSFNLFGDPLVCTPRDAVRSFYSSGIDTLFAGSFVVEK